ncbi:hypothetical protein JCM19046_1382 [Bacillus sp. JCM 19046]|nr:hypothetical protein JCM19046_1382 [Bacillus sp. JCM 19046]
MTVKVLKQIKPKSLSATTIFTDERSGQFHYHQMMSISGDLVRCYRESKQFLMAMPKRLRRLLMKIQLLFS